MLSDNLSDETVEALIEACSMVERAWVGDGNLEISEAVDACLLALDQVDQERNVRPR